MRTQLIALFTAFVLLGAGCSPTPTVLPATRASFDSTVLLSVGKSMTFEDGLRATLTAVNDSRCAKDVVCIWQGELSPNIELSGGALETDATAVLGTERGTSTVAGPYTITLVTATETTATFTIAVAE